MVAFVTRSEELARLRDLYDTLIEPELADFASHAFEDLCNAALRTLYPDHTITDTGHWWYGEHEIDVVGLTAGETLLVGECKSQHSPLGYDALSDLERQPTNWDGPHKTGPTGPSSTRCSPGAASNNPSKKQPATATASACSPSPTS